METQIEKIDGGFIVKVKGRLTTDEAEGFLKSIEPVMEGEGVQISLDLADLEFISSAGIRCLIILLKSCQAKGSALKLLHLTPQIKNIFSLTALLDVFEIAD